MQIKGQKKSQIPSKTPLPAPKNPLKNVNVRTTFLGCVKFLHFFFFCRYIMQMVKVVLVTVLLTLCVIVDCLPHSSTKMRQKRGFRQSIVDRMGHGFGKRANTDLYDPYLTKTP